ncbi:MAG: MFS transporter [Actinomycetota bacterium]
MNEVGSRSSLRRLLTRPNFGRLLASLAVSEVGDWLYNVALIAFILEETGSAAWVGTASILRLLPYTLFGPLGGVLADRHDRRLVMIWSDALRVVLMLLLAAVAATSGSVALAVAIVFLSSTAGAAYSPAVSAATPSVVDETDLATANGIMSTIDNIAIIVGPVIGTLLLFLGSPATAFALNGFTFLISAILIFPVDLKKGDATEQEASSLWQQVTDGFRATTASPEVVVLVALAVAFPFVYGQEIVLLALVSQDLLSTGTEGIGLLYAAAGVGGILAAGLTGKLSENARPGRIVVATTIVSALPLMTLSVIREPALAYVAMTVEGAAVIISEVMTVTLLQRLVPQNVLGRVFGLLDSLAIGMMLLGTVIAPIVLDVAGLPTALLLAGGVLLVVVTAVLPRARTVGARSTERMEELAPAVNVLAAARVFRGASPTTIEALAARAEEQQVAAGQEVIREGATADSFFVVRSGTLDVFSSGGEGGTQERVNSLGRGDHFGEIGLLEGIPRTATVVTTSDCVLYRITGQEFLDSIRQAPAVSRALGNSALRRLARTHPTYRPAASTEEAT